MNGEAVKRRYRTEGDRTCIDIRLHTVQQLFDGRDPAPFRDRDLDTDAIEYLMGALDEIPGRPPLRIVLGFTEPDPRLTAEDVAISVRTFLEHMRLQVERQFREQRRRGALFFAMGLTVLVVFLSLAELTAALPPSTARQILREGLVITGWVALWRPLEAMLYDWWPSFALKRRIQRLLDAEVSVAFGQGAPRLFPSPSRAGSAR